MRDQFTYINWLAGQELGILLDASGVAPANFDTLIGPGYWGPPITSQAMKDFRAIVFAGLNLNGYSEMDIPAEYVAMMISEFIHPHNQMTACHMFQRTYERDDLIAAEGNVTTLSPLRPTQLFAHVCSWNDRFGDTFGDLRIKLMEHLNSGKKAGK